MLGTLIQQTVNALTIGSIYALIALGYTMVYGVLRMINFAHGEMFMLGAYAGFLALTLLIGDIGTAGAIVFTLAFFGAIIAVGFFGVGIERLAYKPLRNSTRLAPMLSSLGMSLILVTGIQILAGPQPVAFPSFFPTTRYTMFGASITSVQIGILVAAFVLMFALYTLVNRSRMGIIVRAVSESRPTAQLLGINVNLAISAVFFSGPLLGLPAASFMPAITASCRPAWARSLASRPSPPPFSVASARSPVPCSVRLFLPSWKWVAPRSCRSSPMVSSARNIATCSPSSFSSSCFS